MACSCGWRFRDVFRCNWLTWFNRIISAVTMEPRSGGLGLLTDAEPPTCIMGFGYFDSVWLWILGLRGSLSNPVVFDLTHSSQMYIAAVWVIQDYA